jgi:hypothetical protein
MSKVIEIKAEPYGALPCEAKSFEVNGIAGDKSDFGNNTDVGSFDYEYDDLADENWACADNQFVSHEQIPDGVLDKYRITEQEYREVQARCEAIFNVGGCGWCV